MFPDDPLLSPRHANFIYRDGKLHVVDEGSVNGVFIRIKAPVDPRPRRAVPDRRAAAAGRAVAARPRPPAGRRGDVLLCQPQAPLEDEADPAPSGRRDRDDLPLAQRHHLDRPRRATTSTSSTIRSSRVRHAQIAMNAEGQVTLTDLGSKNGTFVRIIGRDRARPRRPRLRGPAAPARRGHLSCGSVSMHPTDSLAASTIDAAASGVLVALGSPGVAFDYLQPLRQRKPGPLQVLSRLR